MAGIAGIGSLRASLTQGLAAQGRALLGGDLEVETGGEPPPSALRAWFVARGARVSEIAMMHAMLIAPSGARMLVSLKAVDGAWPLAGQAHFAPAMTVAEALQGAGLVAAPLALQRLGVQPGAEVMLGRARMTLRAALIDAPDQVEGPGLFGPPVLISASALPATQLVVPGSLVRYALRALLPAQTNPKAVAEALGRAFPDQGWQVRDATGAAPGLRRFLDRTALFMTLVALTALLIGGIGVINGVGVWAEARLPAIATLRTLGASARLLAATLLLQVLALALCGIVAGIAIGATVPWLAAALFGAGLPVPPRLGLFPGPLALAGAFGILTALLCMLWPIRRAVRLPGAALFRDLVLPARLPLTATPVAITLALLGALLALALASTAAPRFVLLYAAAAFASLLLLAAAGQILVRLAGHLARLSPRPWLRLGLADLQRPGATTPLMVVSVGLGLATLGAIALVERNLDADLRAGIPSQAPTFYFVDIQNEELQPFEKLMRQLPGVEAFAQVPMLRARVVAVDGVPAGKVPASHATRWALDRDLGLTYASLPPPGNRITAGRWWSADYRGPPLVSLDAKLATGWGVKVGSHLTLNVLGRQITLKVTSLRDITWEKLGLNFFLVASPGLLEGAPHTHIATVRVAPADQATVLRAVTDALPNISAIAVADVLAAVAHIFAAVGTALIALAGLALAAGILVLAGAVAAEQRRRIRQAVILKILGATRSQIRAAWLVSFAAQGAVAGVIGAVVASAASFGVVRYLMHGEWSFLPAPLAVTVLSGIAFLLLAGHWASGAALRAKPARWLRTD